MGFALCVLWELCERRLFFVGIELRLDPRNNTEVVPYNKCRNETEPATHTAGKPVPYKNAGDGFRRIGPGGAA